MSLVKGNAKFAKPTYIPEDDASSMGKLIGCTEANRNVLATISLGHFAAMDPEEGIAAISMVSAGAMKKTSGTVEVTAWNMLPPGAAANAVPILVKDPQSFKTLIKAGYTIHSETTAETRVGLQ